MGGEDAPFVVCFIIMLLLLLLPLFNADDIAAEPIVADGVLFDQTRPKSSICVTGT